MSRRIAHHSSKPSQLFTVESTGYGSLRFATRGSGTFFPFSAISQSLPRGCFVEAQVPLVSAIFYCRRKIALFIDSQSNDLPISVTLLTILPISAGTTRSLKITFVSPPSSRRKQNWNSYSNRSPTNLPFLKIRIRQSQSQTQDYHFVHLFQ
jgi:hypothetical protein